RARRVLAEAARLTRPGGGQDAPAAAPPLELLVEDPSCGPEAVRAALRSGERRRAAAICGDLARLARLTSGVASLEGCGRHALGLLRRDADGLREAVELLRASPRPLALAAALEDLGLALCGAGRREAAIAAFEEALALCSRSGAAAGAVRARRELRALGARRAHRAAERDAGMGWASLTRAEREVARLVADGLSNRRVAERLFVSASTVDTHLQHVFGKLGINSRVQLVRLVATQTAG
ncbi:MAG TPA: helix-turn-helix transcriptional regulator, partial [Candidatus Dormibacteraeota bacterium]|nr:helix-turn-helix transcriptional regulator [Candidatus Dormibacteraeota bacterium]